jgi:hypothetical protein
VNVGDCVRLCIPACAGVVSGFRAGIVVMCALCSFFVCSLFALCLPCALCLLFVCHVCSVKRRPSAGKTFSFACWILVPRNSCNLIFSNVLTSMVASYKPLVFGYAWNTSLSPLRLRLLLHTMNNIV